MLGGTGLQPVRQSPALWTNAVTYTRVMFKRTLIIAFVMCTLAFAQLDSNSVTVTASRNVNLQPDQTVFSVRVDSGLNTSLDDILIALQGSGIGIGNFSGV